MWSSRAGHCGIARELNVTVSELAAVNGIANPDRLMVGEELVVLWVVLGANTRVPTVRLMHWDEVNACSLNQQRQPF